jgi:hypothetical protein
LVAERTGPLASIPLDRVARIGAALAQAVQLMILAANMLDFVYG